MSQPVLTYRLNWGTNLSQKLSGKTFTKPDGTVVDCTSVGVTFSSSVQFNKFYATVVKEGNDFGFIDDVLVDIRPVNPTGILVHELTNRPAGTEFSFNITTTSHITSGEGTYRVGLYAQQADGIWNYEYIFLTVSGEQFQLENNDILQTPVKTS